MAGVFLGMRVPFPSYVGQRLTDAPLFAFECVFHCQSRDSHIDRISSKSALQVFFKRLVFGRHHGDNHHRAIILRHYNAACLARQAEELLGDNFFAFSGFTPKSHAENDVPTIMNWLLPREYPCGDILMFVSPRVYSTTSLLTSFADRNPMSFNCFTTRFPKSLKPGAAKYWKKIR